MELHDDEEMSSSTMPKTNQKPIPLGVVAPKRPVMRRPPLLLKAEHLMSRKGIVALPDALAEARFKGKGHELEDLRLLLSKSKHWAHRLFPKLTFEDFVEKAEQLGTKRPVKNFLTKVRHNMPLNLDPKSTELIQSDGESDHETDVLNMEASQSGTLKESDIVFDRLFADHIEEMKAKDADRPSNDDANSQSSSIPPPKHQQPAVDDFAMDDNDFDDEFLDSVLP